MDGELLWVTKIELLECSWVSVFQSNKKGKKKTKQKKPKTQIHNTIHNTVYVVRCKQTAILGNKMYSNVK